MNESPKRTLVIAPGCVAPDYLSGKPTDCEEAGEIEQSRLSVLTVLFIVTGAFGLPLLWRSDRFSPFAKAAWSVSVMAYTLALFYGMLMMVRWSVGDALK